MKKSLIVILLLVGIVIGIIIISNQLKNPNTNLGQRKIASIELNAKLDSIEKVRYDSLNRERQKRDSILRAKQVYESRPWKLSRYTDEFGDPTGKKFIKYVGTGNFSNSATSRSDLFLKIYCDKGPSVGIFLHEYDWNRSAEKPIGTWSIYLKNSNGQKLTLSTDLEWNHDGGISLKSWNINNQPSQAQQFISFCKRSVGEIQILIRDEYSSSYSFSVDVTGFTREFNSI